MILLLCACLFVLSSASAHHSPAPEAKDSIPPAASVCPAIRSCPDDSLDDGEFNFIFVSNSCFRDSVNTWTHSFTRMIDSAETIPFAITQAELRRIRDAMIWLGIPDINTDVVGYPRCDSLMKALEQQGIQPMYTIATAAGTSGYFYRFSASYRNRKIDLHTAMSGGSYISAVWSDEKGEHSVVCDPRPGADRLNDFCRRLESILGARTEIRALRGVGCM
jgi:hypothetical protein